MKRAARPPAVVIANGDLPPERVVRGAVRLARRSGGIVVCADGGARHAVRLGLRPDAIVGDLDSLPRESRASLRGVPIFFDPDQESTDLEKALRHCLAAGCTSAVVAGAIGDRIDHSAGALSCLKRFGRRIDLTFLDRSGELRLLRRAERIVVEPGEVFSLIPLGRCGGITLRGALYPLEGEALEAGVRDGTSNRATGRFLSIRHRSGTLLLYRPRFTLTRSATPRGGGGRKR